MITRRDLLKGVAAGVAVSAAASTLIRAHEYNASGKGRVYRGPNVLESADHNTCRYGCDVEYHGFGLADAKPEGGRYYPDPMDDPEYRGHHGQGGKYLQHDGHNAPRWMTDYRYGYDRTGDRNPLAFINGRSLRSPRANGRGHQS